MGSHKDDYLQTIQHGINWVTLQQIMALATDKNTAPVTYATVMGFLNTKQKSLNKSRNNKDFNQTAADTITYFMENPTAPIERRETAIPPGSPIGMD